MSHEAPRVGIVLVSHSDRLAEGAADLASQVSGGTVRVLAAGGTDDGELGTSAEKIARAVAGAESGAGVLVLPDLGSAVLTVRAMLAEAGFPDTGFPDTGFPDTGFPDTGLPDTGLPDTEGPGNTQGPGSTEGPGNARESAGTGRPADTGSLADAGEPADVGQLADTAGLADTGGPADTRGPADAGTPAGPPGARVVLADAPFVEGAVAATVTAAAGADLRTVAAAAEEAWHARKL